MRQSDSLSLVVLTVDPPKTSPLHRQANRQAGFNVVGSVLILAIVLAFATMTLWRYWEPRPIQYFDGGFIANLSFMLFVGFALIPITDMATHRWQFQQIRKRYNLFRALVYGRFEGETPNTRIQPIPVSIKASSQINGQSKKKAAQAQLQSEIIAASDHAEMQQSVGTLQSLTITPHTGVIGKFGLPLKTFTLFNPWFTLLYMAFFTQLMVNSLSYVFDFPHRFDQPSALFSMLGYFPMVLANFGFQIILRWMGPRQPLLIDNQGIITTPTRWAPNSRRIAWTDIKGIACIGGIGRMNEPLETFLVATQDALLMWSVTRKTSAASNTLIGIISSQTGLPLRDIGPLNHELDQVGYVFPQAIARRKRAHRRYKVLQYYAERHNPLPAWRQYLAMSTRPLLALATCVLPILIFLAANQPFLAARDAYFIGLPDKIHHLVPLYNAPLNTTPTGWTTLVQTGTTAYTSDGLQLTGKNLFMRLPIKMGDTAIEMSYQFSAKGSTDYAVGFVLHGTNDFGHYLKLSLNDDYRWQLSNVCTPSETPLTDAGLEYESVSLDNHCSDLATDYLYTFAGGSGDNQPFMRHTLLVISHGDAYLIYIDGQYKGGYTDGAGLISGGQSIGIFMQGSGEMTGTISNLHVYALHPATNWEFI